MAASCGAGEALVTAVEGANTARHVQELVQAAGLDGFFTTLAQEVARRCHDYARGRLTVAALLFDFDGRVLGRGSVGG
jgi:cobalt-precorrin-5B (C1)-methyltransferase